jgi:uncharacterized membrane protein YfhO
MKKVKHNGLDVGTPASMKWMFAGLFLLLTAVCSLGILMGSDLDNRLQKGVFAIGFSALLAGLLIGVLYTMQPRERFRKPVHGVCVYPLLAGAVALVCMSLSYVWLGVWPFGTESVMIVDMHHQYGPMLSQLRDMIQNGGNLLYTFETGIGANFISLFAYYIASPFNLLLAVFPERLLTEGILVITLLKNMLSAVFFAACVQYVFRKRDISVVFLALGYSMSMYMLAYSWNIMWLDGVMMLPLIVLGFERMMRTGKYGVYILSLAYTLFTNYYIGFMVCVFLVLYFLLFCFRTQREPGESGKAFLRFALGSLIGGGLAMIILIPVAFALGYTSAAGQGMPEAAGNFDIFRLFSGLLFNASPTIRSGNLPNIYCGVLPVMLTCLLVTTKTIPLRKRLCYGGLVAILGFSFTINIFDLIWHGLHTPNDLPYRFSFLFIFALLMAAAALLPHLKDITPKQIGGVVALFFGYIALYETMLKEGNKGFMSVYGTLLLVGIYATVLLLTVYRKLAVRCAYALLALVMVTELTLSGGLSLDLLNGKEYFTDHSSYVDNEEHFAAKDAVDEMLALADKEMGDVFYRAELLPRRTCVGTALYHYRGLTSFSSSNYYHTTRLLGMLGYADNGVNSYLYNSFVPQVDSLLGIRYVTLQANLQNHPYLTQIGSIKTGETTYYIYRNDLALPVGYRVSATVHTFTPNEYDPFGTGEELLSCMTDDQREMYTFMPIETAENSIGMASTFGDTRFTMTEGDNTAWFVAHTDRQADYFAFVDCTAAQSASVAVLDEQMNTVNEWAASTGEPYIIDIGNLPAGYTVEVSVSAKTAVSGNVFVAALDSAVMREKLALLQNEGLQVTKFSENYIMGTVTAKSMGALFTSIPYDAGWQVTVDGKAVETYPIGDISADGSKGAFLGFNIDPGKHDVTLHFIPKGLKLGGLISIVSLAVFLLLLLVTAARKKPLSPETGEPEKAPLPPTPPAGTLSEKVSLTELMQDDLPAGEQNKTQ